MMKIFVQIVMTVLHIHRSHCSDDYHHDELKTQYYSGTAEPTPHLQTSIQIPCTVMCNLICFKINSAI